MNLVDLAILLIMAVSMVVGMYNGFLLSSLHAASFFISWLGAVIFYPLITKFILKIYPSLLQVITLYAEGSVHIPSVEDRQASITSFTVERVSEIVEQSQLPNPFSKILISDFTKPLEGVFSLGEYFDSTIAVVIINIISFLLLFMLLKLVFIVIISIYKTVNDLPVLRKHDSLAGAGMGLIRSFFILNFIFALVPILLVLAPADIINDFIEGSKLAGFFHHSNIFTAFVRGR
jgi:hypothetical protein